MRHLRSLVCPALLAAALAPAVALGGGPAAAGPRALLYRASPADGADGPCPREGAVHVACGIPEEVALEGLDGSGTLTGRRVRVWGCGGAAVPAAAGVGPCRQDARAGPDGRFEAAPDLEGRGPRDAFAEVQAYQVADRSARFLSRLGAPASLWPIDVLVDVGGEGGAPMVNAYYDAPRRRLLVGRGAGVSLAYDASVVLHELAHVAILDAGKLRTVLDERGLRADATAIREGVADALAAAQLGHPEIGVWAARAQGRPHLREIATVRTCAGSGARLAEAGLETVDGLSGEAHADGLVWASYAWALAEGLRGVKGCGGRCDAASQLQLAALRETAARPGLAFREQAAAVTRAARRLFPARPGVARLATCLAARHGMDLCEGREVPVFAGEPKVVVLDPALPGEPAVAAPVLTFEAMGEARLLVCAGEGAAGVLHLRRGAPPTVSGYGSSLAVEADMAARVEARCGEGAEAVALPGAARWYGLFTAESPGAPADQLNRFQVRAAEGVAGRAAAAAALAPCERVAPEARRGQVTPVKAPAAPADPR